MSDFQQIVVSGRLTRDPELSYTPTGQAVTRLSLASGNWNATKKEEETTFYNVSVWGKQAETINQWGKKGTAMVVSGRPNVRQFTRRDGTVGISNDIEFATYSIVAGMRSKNEVEAESREIEVGREEAERSAF